MKEQKLQKLVTVAKLYYIDEMSQSQIADLMNISRPLVSRMLSQAREDGIVNLSINDPDHIKNCLAQRIKAIYQISDIQISSEPIIENIISAYSIYDFAVSYFSKEFTNCSNIGLGWGLAVEKFVDKIPSSLNTYYFLNNVSQLIGNTNSILKSYHSSEIVRNFSQKTGATPHYLHLPGLLSSQEQINIAKSMDSYHEIEKYWNMLDIIILSIDNSYPLIESCKKYCSYVSNGSILSNFFNDNGSIFDTPNIFPLQIPIESIKNCNIRIGICTPDVNPMIVKSILNSKLITHLIIKQKIAEQII